MTLRKLQFVLIHQLLVLQIKRAQNFNHTHREEPRGHNPERGSIRGTHLIGKVCQITTAKKSHRSKSPLRPLPSNGAINYPRNCVALWRCRRGGRNAFGRFWGQDTGSYLSEPIQVSSFGLCATEGRGRSATNLWRGHVSRRGVTRFEFDSRRRIEHRVCSFSRALHVSRFRLEALGEAEGGGCFDQVTCTPRKAEVTDCKTAGTANTRFARVS